MSILGSPSGTRASCSRDGSPQRAGLWGQHACGLGSG